MSKIVDMQEQLEKKKQKDHLERYQGRVASIQKIIQCSSCHYRCALCGYQVTQEGDKTPSGEGLALCDDCRAEFEEYLAQSKGLKQPETFWHNKEWLHLWSTWLEYRKAITAFITSREYELLLEGIHSDR